MTSQFAYHNFSTAEGIIRLRPRLLLVIHKIAVGKREAVAFKYRLNSILSHWCQPPPPGISLQLKRRSRLPKTTKKQSRRSKSSAASSLRIHFSRFFHLASMSIDTINSIEIYHAKFSCYSVWLLSCGLAPVLKALEPCTTISHILVYIGVNRHRQLHWNLSYKTVFASRPNFDTRIRPSLAPYMHRGRKAIDERFQSCTGVDRHHNSTESYHLKQLIFLLISVGLISPSLDTLWNSERLHFVNCPSYTGVDRHHHSKRYLFEAVGTSLLHLQGWYAPLLTRASRQGINLQLVCIDCHMHAVGFEHLI